MLRVDISARKGEFHLRPAFEAADELVVLIGESGSGKSLTLKAIAGLLEPDAGRIVLPDGTMAFDAEARINVPPQERNVGYVVQDLALFPHLTVQQNIDFAISHWQASQRRERIAELIAMLGLQGMERRRPGEISGGQQQRVALARALACEPRLLLLDEPFAALDSALRTLLRRELLALRRRLGLTALFVTHDIAEAYALADRIVAYHDGAVLQSGTREEIFYRPNSVGVARLVDVRNFVPGEVVDQQGDDTAVRTPWFTANVPESSRKAGSPAYVCVRPEHVVVLREGHGPRHAADPVIDVEILDDTPGASVHRLMMRTVAPEGSAAEPFVFEVDVPTHPYEVIEVASRREWKIVLPHERLFLVDR